MLVLQQNIIGRQFAPPVEIDEGFGRLSPIVARHADKSRPYIVSVHRQGMALRPTDDTVRMRDDWAETLVGSDEIVVITYLPMGGGGSSTGPSQGKQIGSAVALVALAIAAPYLVGGLGVPFLGTTGALTFAGSALSAGIVIGGAYLIGQATKAKSDSAADNSQVYGVAGGGNIPRKGDRIPVGYGRFWTQPDLTQPDYFVYDGEDQVLYKRMTLGLGKYQVHTIMVGTATMWDENTGLHAPFNSLPGPSGLGGTGSTSGGGSEIEIIAPGGSSALVPDSVFSCPSVGGGEIQRQAIGYTGPFPANPDGEDTTLIQLDFSLPAGAYGPSSNGQPAFCGWGVTFEYAPCDADNNPTAAFTVLYQTSGSLNSTRAIRFTRQVTVSSGRYVVRAMNTVADVSGYTNSVTWDGLRSHLNYGITRPHVTEVALRVRSGKNLGVTSFNDVWVEATRILPTWNGSSWVEAQTQKSVYAFKDILQATYGGNLDDSEVDFATIKSRAGALSQYDTFDGVIRGPVSVYEACTTVLGTMRAEPRRLGNLMTISRDEQQAVRKHVFSRRQIKRGTSVADFKTGRNDGLSDVIVEYSPGGDPRLRREARSTFGAQSLTPRRQQLIGVSSYNHAYHLATWMAASAYYRRETRKFSVDRQGRLVTRGDTSIVESWFMSDSRAAGIMSRSSLELTLDTDVVVGGSTYCLLRDRNGVEWGPVKVTAGAHANIIELDSTDVTATQGSQGLLSDVLSADNEDMTTAIVGPIEELQDGFIIQSVQPQGRDDIQIDALRDAPEVWTALGGSTPTQPTIPSQGDETHPAVPIIPWIKAQTVQKAVSLEMEWAVGQARGAVSYVVQISYDSGTSWETVSEGLSTSGTYTVRHDHDGVTVQVTAYAVSDTGLPGPSVSTSFQTYKPVVSSETSDLLVQIENFKSELKDYVTTYLQTGLSELAFRYQSIAQAASEQDAANLLDKVSTRTLLEATVGDITATITETAEIAQSIDGKLQAAWFVTVNVNGYLSGIENYNNGSTADLIMVADNLKFAFPGQSGGAPVPIFTIANVNGVAKISFRGDMFADGTITAQKLSVATLSAITANVGFLQVGSKIDIDGPNTRILIRDA